MNISIVIPTYNRGLVLQKIFKSLKKIKPKKTKLEINICDSYSFDITPIVVKNFLRIDPEIKINYFNISHNILSSKRNYGILKSKYKNIILLDDDCIPQKNFITNYISEFARIDDNTILSGVVKYDNRYLKKSGYLKFRDSKHFKKVNKKDVLSPKFIVAMNMGFKISRKNKHILKFDERFVGYGFEDFEFAFRLSKLGFVLKKTKASILHDDGIPNLEKYLKKYYHLGRDGMRNIIKINRAAAKDLMYFKIETNLLFRIFFFIPFVFFFLKYFEKLIIFFEKICIFNYDIIYEIARISAYSRGFNDRFKINNNKMKNWYE